MSFEEQLRVWSAVIDVASVFPVAVPLVVALRKRGSIFRKSLVVVGTLLASWVIAATLVVVVVVPALAVEEPLARKVLFEPQVGEVWSQFWAVARSVGQYWYFVGQIALPVLAAAASLPVSRFLSRKLLLAGQGVQSAA